jgi:transcriptional regulator NrdR family protein
VKLAALSCTKCGGDTVPVANIPGKRQCNSCGTRFNVNKKSRDSRRMIISSDPVNLREGASEVKEL